MNLWRDYLEQYADNEGDVEGQVIVGAYHAVEALTAFSRKLDSGTRYKRLIDQREFLFNEGSRQAALFQDRLLNAAFAIYNSLNTLSHQFTEGNDPAAALIRKVDEQARLSIESGTPEGRSDAALRAGFVLFSLIAITLDQNRSMTAAIRQIEKRFASGAAAASSDWERLLNSLYRIVEMVQIVVLLVSPESADRANQIASRFQEEDQERELPSKLRNGFCRLFEFVNLLTAD